MDDFTEDQIEGIKVLFKQFDTDGSGKIDMAEFKLLARKMGIEMTDDKLRESIQAVAEGDDPELGFDEFVQWLRNSQTNGDDPFSMLKAKIKSKGMKPLTNQQIEQLRQCFNTFDADNSGAIDVEELGNVFASFGQDMTDEEVRAMIQDVDDDGSGEIEFEEFMLLMMSNFGQEETVAEDIQSCCRKYDGKTGRVTKADFEKIIRELCGEALSDKEIADIADCAANAASPNGRGNPTDEGLIEWEKWESLWEAVQEGM